MELISTVSTFSREIGSTEISIVAKQKFWNFPEEFVVTFLRSALIKLDWELI
jgi:hypothetical protein